MVRHGETDYNLAGRMQGRSIDAPLNQTGFLQAEAAAAFFESIPVDFVAASSLTRALQTAGVIAAAHGLPVVSHAGLDEMAFGVLEGKTYVEAEQELITLRNAWKNGALHTASERGESAAAVYERADRAGRALIETNSFHHGVFVVHGRLIRILLAGWLEIGLHRMEEIQHANAAVNILEYENGRFRPIELNITRHLQSPKTTFV